MNLNLTKNAISTIIAQAFSTENIEDPEQQDCNLFRTGYLKYARQTSVDTPNKFLIRYEGKLDLIKTCPFQETSPEIIQYPRKAVNLQSFNARDLSLLRQWLIKHIQISRSLQFMHATLRESSLTK